MAWLCALLFSALSLLFLCSALLYSSLHKVKEERMFFCASLFISPLSPLPFTRIQHCAWRARQRRTLTLTTLTGSKRVPVRAMATDKEAKPDILMPRQPPSPPLPMQSSFLSAIALLPFLCLVANSYPVANDSKTRKGIFEGTAASLPYSRQAVSMWDKVKRLRSIIRDASTHA